MWHGHFPNKRDKLVESPSHLDLEKWNWRINISTTFTCAACLGSECTKSYVPLNQIFLFSFTYKYIYFCLFYRRIFFVVSYWKIASFSLKNSDHNCEQLKAYFDERLNKIFQLLKTRPPNFKREAPDYFFWLN